MNTSSLQKSFIRARNLIDEILDHALSRGATDVHLRGGLPPRIRVRGEILEVPDHFGDVRNDDLWKFLKGTLNSFQLERFEGGHAVDLSYVRADQRGSFRLNASRAQGQIIITTRPIRLVIPTFEELNLPAMIETICQFERGLVLVVGATGSGKSTTLASIIGHINNHQKSHIVTIEDPIEYHFKNKKGLVTQKEVGRDVPDFKSALRAALRQDPDVIMVGEIRDRETLDTALQAAETGHLVFATLHTMDARESINRIVTQYDSSQQLQIRYQLSSILKAVIGQRLIPRQDGQGMIPAVEVMITNERIREMIQEPERTRDIKNAIEEGHVHFNMQSFDQSLLELHTKGLISFDTALKSTTQPDEFLLKSQGIQTIQGEKFQDFDFETPEATPLVSQYPPPWRRKAPSFNPEGERRQKDLVDQPGFLSLFYAFTFGMLVFGIFLFHFGVKTHGQQSPKVALSHPRHK